MNMIIQNLKDITDSRELLEARPPKFTSIFAYILIALLVIALIWTYFGQIDVVIKSNGVVRSNDKTITILNEVDGKVKDVNFKEGQKVRKGDILYTVEYKDALLSKTNLEKQLQDLQIETSNRENLRKSILDLKNYFVADNPDEKDFFNKFLQYKSTHEKLLLTQKQTELQSDVTNDNKLISSKSLTQQIGENNDVITSLNTLLQSISENKNLFSDSNNIYSSKYSDYQYNIQDLEISIEQKKLALQNAKDKYIQATTDYQNQMDNAQAANSIANSKLQGYKSEYLSQIANSITQANTSLSDIQYAYPTTNTQLAQTQNTLDNLQLLVQSINIGQNLFTDPDSTFYKQYLDYSNNVQKYLGAEQLAYENSYLMNINQSIDTAHNTLAQLQATSSATSVKAGIINQTINNLQMLQSSINDNINYFSQSNTEYYNKFVTYQTNRSELQINISTQSQLIASLEAKKNAIIDDYNSQVTAAQKVLKSAEINLPKYQNQSTLDLKSKLDDANNSTEKLQAQLEQAKLAPDLDNINNQLAENDILKYKMDTLVQLDDSIKQNRQKIDELNTNISSVQLNIDKSTVVAPIDGVINVANDISKTQLIKSGEKILSVIPQNSSQYKVQLFVSNKDIAGMKIGSKIKYHFQALPYNEYGELTGTITDIAVDSTVDQQSGASYYLVESEIQNKPLFGYKGEKAELKIGMTCEAQVITKNKKILYYLLEKINLKN